MASEPKSLTIQETKVCAWIMTSVLLKIGFGGIGVETAGKKVTLDHVGKANGYASFGSFREEKVPSQKRLTNISAGIWQIACVVVWSRRVQRQMCIFKTSWRTQEMP